MKKQLRNSIASVLLLATSGAFAQTCFTTGTGSDGAYIATANTTLVGGTYNYTTFTINTGVTVNVTGTQPLIIYCTGAVTINGVLTAQGANGTDGITYTAAGTGGAGVAGGGNGGNGTYSASLGGMMASPGSGPGGANNQGNAWSGGGGAGYSAAGGSTLNVPNGQGGPAYGTADIAGFEAGSGGGGGSGGFSCGAGGGGAGGGLIYIAAQGGITIGATGTINVNGGNGGSDGTGNCGGGGGGSGGSIILRAGTMTNNGSLLANGGIGGLSQVNYSPYWGQGQNGAAGRIRLDYNGALLGTGTSSPAVGYTLGVPTTTLAANMSSTNIQCNGANNGSATVVVTGGVPSYTYAWTPSGGSAPTASGLSVGTYTCTVTDALGCTSTATATITEPSQLQVVGSTLNPSCFASCDGMINATAFGGTPPYAYAWSPNGSTSPMITGLCNGCYTLTLTDAVGCTSTNVFCVTEPSTAVTATVSITDASCNGGCDGTGTITNVTGGTPPYSYAWCNGSTTSSVANLCPGSCMVYITDANGCPFTDTILITQPAPAAVNVLGSDTLICDPYVLNLCANGNFTTFAWSNGATTPCVQVDTTECLSVMLTDGAGCVSVDTVCVTDDICLGITPTSELSIGIVPNPSTGVIHVLHGKQEAQLVEVFDAQGKKCSSGMIADNGEMNLNALPAGVYSVRVNGAVHRLVITK